MLTKAASVYNHRSRNWPWSWACVQLPALTRMTAEADPRLSQFPSLESGNKTSLTALTLTRVSESLYVKGLGQGRFSLNNCSYYFDS